MTKTEITLIKSLSDRKVRQIEGLFVAEGRKLVAELAASGLRHHKIFCVGDISVPGVQCETVTPREMERISHLRTPSDMLALVAIPQRKFDPAAFGAKLTLALDGVQDPGNLGTIIRTADWFGVEEIVCSLDSADCFNPKVVQATMGAIARVRVHYLPLVEALQRVVAPVYGTFLDGENICRSQLSPGGIVVLGSEGQGISSAVERLVTRRLFIPPYPGDVPTSESLNVATAAAIVCHEFRRGVIING